MKNSIKVKINQIENKLRNKLPVYKMEKRTLFHILNFLCMDKEIEGGHFSKEGDLSLKFLKKQLPNGQRIANTYFHKVETEQSLLKQKFNIDVFSTDNDLDEKTATLLYKHSKNELKQFFLDFAIEITGQDISGLDEEEKRFNLSIYQYSFLYLLSTIRLGENPDLNLKKEILTIC